MFYRETALLPRGGRDLHDHVCASARQCLHIYTLVYTYWIYTVPTPVFLVSMNWGRNTKLVHCLLTEIPPTMLKRMTKRAPHMFCICVRHFKRTQTETYTHTRKISRLVRLHRSLSLSLSSLPQISTKPFCNFVKYDDRGPIQISSTCHAVY